MNEETNWLSETFAAHEHLAPDEVDVLAKAHAIARNLHRRRWALRATGGAVLSAGLVAGGIALPGRVGHANPSGPALALGYAASGDPSPSATPDPTQPYTTAQELSEYWNAGYNNDDAQTLAGLWNESGTDLTTVKAAAGLDLLEGQSLPIKPSNQPAPPENLNVDAFFAAGYTYWDAVAIGALWHDSNTYQVKGEAGKKLLDGQPLPIQPNSTPTPPEPTITPPTGFVGTSATESAADRGRAAFAAAGLSYQDAVRLGKLWHDPDTYRVKAEAGRKLLAGHRLPIAR